MCPVVYWMDNGIVIRFRAIKGVMVPSNNHAERQLPHKATLYCPNCEHESRINGDWIIHVHSNHLDYECPECGYVIESRSDDPAVIPSA